MCVVLGLFHPSPWRERKIEKFLSSSACTYMGDANAIAHAHCRCGVAYTNNKKPGHYHNSIRDVCAHLCCILSCCAAAVALLLPTYSCAFFVVTREKRTLRGKIYPWEQQKSSLVVFPCTIKLVFYLYVTARVYCARKLFLLALKSRIFFCRCDEENTEELIRGAFWKKLIFP